MAHQLSKENDVIVIDNLSTGRLDNITILTKANSIEFVRGSILNLQLLEYVFHNIDFVFHQAAIPSITRNMNDLILSNRVNISGTLNVLLASRDNKINELVQYISDVLNVDVKLIYESPRTGDVRDSLADITHATKDLNYRPEYSLKNGFLELIST